MQSDHHPRSRQSWEHLFDKDPHSSTGFRIGVVAAILIHTGIFAVTWPTIAQAPPEQTEQVLYPYPITDFVPAPPEPEEILIELPVAQPEGPPIVNGPPEEVPFQPTITESINPPPGTVEVVDIPVSLPDFPEPPQTIVTVNVEVDPPAVTHRIEPRYTEPARFAKIQGVVILDLVIDTEGRVESIQVMRGLPLGLTQSAVDAVERWRFHPSVYKNRPVAVRYILTVRFTLA